MLIGNDVKIGVLEQKVENLEDEVQKLKELVEILINDKGGK